VGDGFRLAPNALKLLAALGLAEALKRNSGRESRVFDAGLLGFRAAMDNGCINAFASFLIMS
jgi:hypothetical protein